MAAQLLCTGEFTESTIPQGVYAELRAAHNAYRRLVKEQTGITNLVKGLLDGLFPEFTMIFKDPCALTALSVLSTCPIPEVIARITEDEFVAAIEEKHLRRLMRKKLVSCLGNILTKSSDLFQDRISGCRPSEGVGSTIVLINKQLYFNNQGFDTPECSAAMAF